MCECVMCENCVVVCVRLCVCIRETVCYMCETVCLCEAVCVAFIVYFQIQVSLSITAAVRNDWTEPSLLLQRIPRHLHHASEYE